MYLDQCITKRRKFLRSAPMICYLPITNTLHTKSSRTIIFLVSRCCYTFSKFSISDYLPQEDNSPQHQSQDQIVATLLLGPLFSHPDIFLFAHAAEPVKADLVAVGIDDVTFEDAGWAVVTGLRKNQIEIDRHVRKWRKV